MLTLISQKHRSLNELLLLHQVVPGPRGIYPSGHCTAYPVHVITSCNVVVVRAGCFLQNSCSGLVMTWKNKSCVEPPSSAVSMMLPTFATCACSTVPAVHPQLSINISYIQGTQQQTCWSPLLLLLDGTVQQSNCYIDPASYTMWAASVTVCIMFLWQFMFRVGVLQCVWCWTVCRGRSRWCGYEWTTHCTCQTSSIKVCLSQLCQITVYQIVFAFIDPSVLWRCWLGGRKGIRPVKNWVVGCWRGCLPGARSRLVYVSADATATHCLLLQ